MKIGMVRYAVKGGNVNSYLPSFWKAKRKERASFENILSVQSKTLFRNERMHNKAKWKLEKLSKMTDKLSSNVLQNKYLSQVHCQADLNNDIFGWSFRFSYTCNSFYDIDKK